MKETIELLKEQKILYLLALLCLAMILDGITGIMAAKMRKEFTSKIGINGLLRKVWSLILLVFFLPVSLCIPLNAGLGILYFFYLSYLFMEIHSILENYSKMGMDSSIFKKYVEVLQNFLNKK